MKKNRITESQLHNIIKESVKRVLREGESIVDYDDELRNDYDEWETQNEMWVDYVSEHLDDTKNTAMLHLIGGLKSAIANMHRLAGHTGSAY